MTSRFVSSLALPSGYDGEISWFVFRGHDLVVRDPNDGSFVEVPVARQLSELGVTAIRSQVLGHFDGRPACCVEIDASTELPPGFVAYSLRRLFGRMEQAVFDVAGTAYQVQYWDKTHQVCAACASVLEYRSGSRSKQCVTCKIEYFPRVAPAMIVLVEDGDMLLMARHSQLPPGMYALVAGFVEPGETLEECVAREVLEETGIEVDDIRYFASQPWPFPHQIMVAFFARKCGGDLRVDKEELEDAQFFHYKNLPMLPPPISVARKLIDAWLEQKRI
jgi:NAD+ diphosphatase